MSFPVHLGFAHPRFVQSSALLIGCALLPATALAQISFQSHQIAQDPNVTLIAGHGDFNGDGPEDLLIERFTQTSTGFMPTPQIYLSNGDGSYDAPKTLPAAVSPGYTAIGDFNNDGKLDFVTQSGSSIVVCLGNGDGTFQAPKTITSANNNVSAVVAADLNHDNKTDFAVLLNGPTPTLQLWISNGNGSFTKGQTVGVSGGGSALSSAVTGDFDGDGKPDVAILFSALGSTSVEVFYGDAAGHLGSPNLINDAKGYDDLNLVVADVNNDGRSDLIGPGFIYGVDGTSQFVPEIAVFTGNANRTMSYKNLSTSQCPGDVAVADFNGDGVNDLAYSEGSCTTLVNNDFVIQLGTGSGNFGAGQTVYQNTFNNYQPYVVRTTIGTKPDLVFTEDTAAHNDPSTNPPEALVLLSNNTVAAFPNCGITVAEGISICQPQPKSASPVIFSLATAGPTPMRTAAVWVDGKKVDEQLTHAFSNYSFLDASIPMALGTHKVTIFGTGWDNTLEQKTFSVDVNSNNGCGAPTSPGVFLCQPAEDTTVSSPVKVVATATVTGTFARMEVWIDGVKKYTQTTNPVLSTTIPVSAGTHRFGVFAVNTAGTKWEAVANATVK